jgi:chromosome segregation ATPase
MAGRRLLVWGTGAVLALGCASSKQEVVRADDSGLARLNESQMEPVDDARVEEGHAHDAVAKAKANDADARARLEVAKSERAVSEAQLKRALAERDLLKKQYAAKDVLARADEQIAAAQERVKATDLKLAYLNQMIGVSESERKAAEAHVITAQAKVEQAKYRAMKAGNAPQADVVNGGEIDKRLAEAQGQEAAFQKQAAERRSAAVELYNRWEQADVRVRTLARPENMPVPPPTMAEPSK